MRTLQTKSIFALPFAILLFAAHGVSAQNRTVDATMQPDAQLLLRLANQARAAAGAGPLEWDPALATAARKHCLRMAAAGNISHRYADEQDLSERAGSAGAHFSLVEENVASAWDAEAIHDAWMHSPGHRTNLLNPEVNRVGIALVAGRNTLYAVADYSRAVEVRTQEQIEATVARNLQAHGMTILSDPTGARAACELDHGLPRSLSGPQPRFVFRWQQADLDHLPQQLVDTLASGEYKQASVGSCAPQNVNGAFTTYRVAVLLYGLPSADQIRSFD
jgi:uncharacterized protein YkwD